MEIMSDIRLESWFAGEGGFVEGGGKIIRRFSFLVEVGLGLSFIIWVIEMGQFRFLADYSLKNTDF